MLGVPTSIKSATTSIAILLYIELTPLVAQARPAGRGAAACPGTSHVVSPEYLPGAEMWRESLTSPSPSGGRRRRCLASKQVRVCTPASHSFTPLLRRGYADPRSVFIVKPEC